MIQTNESKLSMMVTEEANSFDIHTHAIRTAQLQLEKLKKENSSLNNTLRAFREETKALMGEWAAMMGSVLHRQLKEKQILEHELQKSRDVQGNMRGEVIKLKEMIQSAIEEYERQIQKKDEVVKEKNQEIQILIKQLKLYEQEKGQDSLRADESITEERTTLEVIQQQSEHATHSSAAVTVRDPKQDRIFPQLDCNPITLAAEPEPQPIQKENSDFRAEHKRTKTFIDHFRKTIGESFSEKQQQEKRLKVPLQQLQVNDAQYHYSHNLKECQKENMPSKTIYMQKQPNQISNSSSSSDLIANTEAESINIPKKFQTPINLMFFKKKETPCNRVMTEPSPQRHSKCDNYFSKPYSLNRSQERRSGSKQRSNRSIEDGKSLKSSISKEKIKITAKMVDEVGQSAKKGAHSKALVYLGGKSIFRKFLLQLKSALKQYSIITYSTRDEVKYEGGRRNSQRWGTGRAIYQNGGIYQGQFRQNMRHGRGCLSLNGIQIYQGQWQHDKLHGQGYIKSMKYMSSSCHAIFKEASYCGSLLENRPHGIGTIFLNSKEKIVTKFSQGVPMGELTYYNINQIQFGVWPSE